MTFVIDGFRQNLSLDAASLQRSFIVLEMLGDLMSPAIYPVSFGEYGKFGDDVVVTLLLVSTQQC
jgi:hypothetical protein